MNQYSEIIKRFQAVEDELAKLRKQRNYELYNLDEENVPRLREYSKLISENQKAISLVEQNVSDVESSVTLLSQYVNESIVELETLTGQIDNELKTVKTNLATVETKADDAAASAELAAQSVTELESEVSGQIRTLTQNVASVKATADSASASVSAIVKNVGSNGAVTAASIVAKINDAGSSVQISADHISLKGKTIALTADTIDITSTYFNVSTSGAVECTSLNVTGDKSTINIEGNSLSSAIVKVSYNDLEYYTNVIPNGIYTKTGTLNSELSPSRLRIGADGGYYNQYSLMTSSQITCTYGQYMYPTFEANSIYNQVIVGGALFVYGSFNQKSKVSQTESYGDKALYCVESPSPYYSDYGRGTISEDGMLTVWLDPVFIECIDQNYDYFVQITLESTGNCYVSERYFDHFTVKGDPGTQFMFVITAPQNSLSAQRLETFVMPEEEDRIETNLENANYDAIGNSVLNEYENQIL